jgi:N-acetylneuraminic acid mutarotase
VQRILILSLIPIACADADPRMDAGIADAAIEDASTTDAAPKDGALGDAAVDAGEPGTGRFERIPDLPEGPRQETAVVALEGEVYVLGGYDENGQFGTLVEVYDHGSNSWRRAADLPVPMHHANAAAAAGKIYVLGFLAAGFVESERAFSYDPSANEWTEIAPLPEQRRRGASVTVSLDDTIYVVGGLRGLSSVADVDEFDPSTNTFRPLPPLPRRMDHGVGGAFDGKLFVAGGRAGGITSHTDRFDVFDLATGEWTVGPSMPTSRAGAAAAMLLGRLYVFGGEGNRADPVTGLFEAVEVYDVMLDRWFSLTPMDPPRHGMGAAETTDRIIVPGGATVEGFGATAMSEAFIP